MKQNYEQAVEEFLQQMSREYYLNGAGLKESLDILPIYNEYSWLFGRGTVEELLARDDEEGRYLAEFAADGFIDESVKELSESITNEATQATIEWDGEQIAYRKASVVLANEPDPARRQKLESVIHAKTEELNPKRVERLEKLHSQATDLGFDSYLDMYIKLKRLKFDWLLDGMTSLLEDTREVYQEELSHYLDQLGVDKAAATPADIAHLFRAPQFDALFPQEKLVPALKATLSGLGIDLDSQQNVHLDIDARPMKSPRAFCVPLRVPDEVYLVVFPRGGQDDYSAILHESGHVQHFGHISPDLPLAYKRFGDGALSEGYAYVFDNLMKNANWMVEVMGANHAEEYLRLARFHKLWLVRRYAAKLQYESELHTTDNIPEMRSRYASILGSSLDIKISESNFLADVDDGIYATNYLRAWVFEVMLRKHFEDNFGMLWFKNPKVGDFLVNLWKDGQKYSADELIRRIGYEGMDIRQLVLELAR